MSFESARRNAGMTQQQAANSLGITKAAVSLWETGEGMPSTKRLPQIAALYGCTIDELLKAQEC